MKSNNEMVFARELWKIILEAEELIRKRYLQLAENIIYDLDDEDEDHFTPGPF